MACNCALSPPLEFRRKITSDFHVDCKWGPGHQPWLLPFGVVHTSCPPEVLGTARSASYLLPVPNRLSPPHPSSLPEGRWRLLPDCLFCPIPPQIWPFLTLQSHPGLGTATLLSGGSVLFSSACPSLHAPPPTLDSTLLFPPNMSGTEMLFQLSRSRFCPFSA